MTPEDVHSVGLFSKRRKKLLKADDAGLVVVRRLTVGSAAQLRQWADDQGLQLLVDDLHATIVRSTVAIPWDADTDPVAVLPTDMQGIWMLGDDGALALHFRSEPLAVRHLLAERSGAVWDHDSYQPHVTLCYDCTVDTYDVTLPGFSLMFGPEEADRLVPVTKGIEVTIMKTNTEKRLVTGWASIIENPDGTPHYDTQGDMIDEDTLLAAAHRFMADSRQSGEMHVRKTGIGTVVDSMVFTRDVKKALGLPDSFPTGWLLTHHVTDDTVWAKVKSGEYAGFSIGGSGVRDEV